MGILKELASDLMQDAPAFRTKIAQARKFSVRMSNVLNFVWIGDCGRANFTYLSLWQKFNPQARMLVWTDDSSNFCPRFQHYLLEGSSDPARTPSASGKNLPHRHCHSSSLWYSCCRADIVRNFCPMPAHQIFTAF